MDEEDIKNLIKNISLDYKFEDNHIKISLNYSGYYKETIDTCWISLKELKDALNNLEQ